MVSKLRTAAAKLAGRISRDVLRVSALLLVELAGSGAILDGIAHYSRPIALIVGGLGAILAVERQPRKATAQEKALGNLIKERLS